MHSHAHALTRSQARTYAHTNTACYLTPLPCRPLVSLHPGPRPQTYTAFKDKLAEVQSDAADGVADDEEGGADESNAVWPMLLWRPGVGFSKVQAPAVTTWNANRTELLRLLIALASQSLYMTPQAASPPRSKFLDEATQNCVFAPSLFYSLINAALSYDPVSPPPPSSPSAFAVPVEKAAT